MLGAVMGRIDPCEVERTGCVQWVRSAVLVALTLVVAACGDDPGGPFVMPAGQEYAAVGTDRVLVVVESQNECGDLGGCVPKPAGPCDFGEDNGNVRGLAIYRLGASGHFVSPNGSQSGVRPEEVIPTDDSPRRVVSHPLDPTLLYVATLERVQVFRLRPGGGSFCIDQTFTDAEIDPDGDRDEELDPFELVIDPSVGAFGVLYIAANKVGRIDAYEIAADGTLPPIPSSCIVGGSDQEFSSIAPINSTFFATGSRSRVEIYERVNGHFPDVQSTPTPTFTPEFTPDPNQPTATPTPAPMATGPTPAPTRSPAPLCIEALRVTSSLSSLGAGRATDIEFLPSAKALEAETLGSLVVAEEFSDRLISFPVDPNGQIDGDDDGRTERTGFYQRILRADRNGTTFFYASAFQQGETNVFQLGDPEDDEDRLSGTPLSRTRADPFSLPVGLAIDGDSGPILYVAQGGLARIDGFRIRADGGTDEIPATSTSRPLGIDGRTLELFPTDLVVVPLP